MARAANRGRARARPSANASFTSRARRTASSADSTWTPGVVRVMTCVSTPSRSITVLPVGDVAMPAHRDVVVAGVVQERVALGVRGHPDARGAAGDRVEVRGRIVMIVNVDDRHRVVAGHCGGKTQAAGDPFTLRTPQVPSPCWDARVKLDGRSRSRRAGGGRGHGAGDARSRRRGGRRGGLDLLAGTASVPRPRRDGGRKIAAGGGRAVAGDGRRRRRAD